MISKFIFQRFLTTSGNLDIRRWSADGLAYLTLDADVKEEFIDNLLALKTLFNLCQCDDAHVLYSITTIFVNLTNTYPTRKPDKQMEELATYAKQRIPKEHPKVRKTKEKLRIYSNFRFFKKDDKEFYEERRRKLVEAGIIPVLVQLCKHKSENCREQLARLDRRFSDRDKEQNIKEDFRFFLKNFSWSLRK